ncbi:signal peptidase I [Micrococcoides hystricis]|uniref:Signal peptidase I n=1 Tax=Micrococcoides hystricis TaxID=1572761 RepID=A0ABV6PC46_9MICC
MHPEQTVTKRQSFFGWRLVLLTLAAVVVLTGLLRATVVEIYTIPTDSMEPTLDSGEKILVNRLAYLGEQPQKGDLVVFDGRGSFTPYEPDRPPLQAIGQWLGELSGISPPEGIFIKRVMATEGDHIRCCNDDGEIVLNGEVLVEDYLPSGVNASETQFDMILPKERVWLMGDNRPASADSRALLGAPGGGAVPVNKIIGRVIGH